MSCIAAALQGRRVSPKYSVPVPDLSIITEPRHLPSSNCRRYQRVADIPARATRDALALGW
jgi:hypothetical protein